MRAETVDTSTANHSAARMRNFSISGPKEREIEGDARVSYTVTTMDYPPSLGHTPHYHQTWLEAVTRKTETPCQDQPRKEQQEGQAGLLETKRVWLSHKVLQKDNF